MLEFETKVININKSEIIENLRNLGAKEEAEYLMRRWVFDIDSKNIEWIRLRQEKGRCKLTYKFKEIGITKIGKTEEIEVMVSDFEKTAEILSKLTFKRKFYQENKIYIFRLNDIEFSIATWPKIEPYLEIESTSEIKVKEGLKLLGLEGKDSGDVLFEDLYKEIGKTIPNFPTLTF